MDVLLSAQDLAESQRSFELRKVFAPEQSDADGIEASFNANLNCDGALDAYAETILWRLQAVHAMVSLIDRGHQYFLAGAVRTRRSGQEQDDDDVVTQQQWFGCDSVPTPGGLCENTLSLDTTLEEFPCFIINDLSKDDRFKDLPVVDGTLSSYRFYAGTPITTNHGVNIGSFFIFDDKIREGLTRSQRKFLHQQANNIMKHLGTKREAADRRRAALMTEGIGRFLEKTAQYREYEEAETSDSVDIASHIDSYKQPQVVDGVLLSTAPPSFDELAPKTSVQDRIRMALDQAAELLRESFEITSGGVVFLDASLANLEVDKSDEIVRLMSADPSAVGTEHRIAQMLDTTLRQRSPPESEILGRHLSQSLVRSSLDKHKPPRIIAASVPRDDLWDPTVGVLNSNTLAALIKSYPKGNVWSIDVKGYYSSLQQISNWERAGLHSPAERQSSMSAEDLNRQRFEAAVLSQIFETARQIIFLPLWDSGANRWHSGCFVWSQFSVPVFSVDSELTHLLAFTNSMMIEISRLDAITANKMKSDFLGSISHEFRSPLHGILASAEFLRDSLLDKSQSELVSTIQNCSGTLLDTINHVLDYSKINSFEIASNQEGPVSSQSYHATNLALLCESVVEGMIAAQSFRGNSLDDAPTSSLSEGYSHGVPRTQDYPNSNVEIILDIEPRDWNFRVDAGAIQRIIMNLLGNAQKFTASGFIIVQLRIIEQEEHDETIKPSSCILSLKIKDSGKGMSTEFMERKLYRPFAQEDTFVPGVGLGLSIVWSIINQLGGKIHMRSEQGKGTDVEVTLAVEKANGPSHTHLLPGDLVRMPLDAEQLVTKLRDRAVGKSVSFSRRKRISSTDHRDILWRCLERCISIWFGFVVNNTGADLVVTDQPDRVDYTEGQRGLIIQDSNTPGSRNVIGTANICNPIGPFKLARCILGLMDQQSSIDITSALETAASGSDRSTQNPLGPPEERHVMNGIIMTDYGFTPGSSSSSKDATTQIQLRELSEDQARSETEPSFPAPRTPSGKTRRLPQREASKRRSAPIAAVTAPDRLAPDNISPQSIPLPASPLRSPIISGIPVSGSKVTPRSLRILAVDDNMINLQLLCRYLCKRKEDVVLTATNGVEAVEAFKKAEGDLKFDIIFMDISMPELDGFEATRLIRSHERSQLYRSISDLEADIVGKENKRPDSQENILPQDSSEGKTDELARVYIVALTGLASRRDRDEAEHSGLDEFLTKPISFKRIGELLDRLRSGE